MVKYVSVESYIQRERRRKRERENECSPKQMKIMDLQKPNTKNQTKMQMNIELFAHSRFLVFQTYIFFIIFSEKK